MSKKVPKNKMPIQRVFKGLMGRLLKPSAPDFPMPKYQACKICGAGAKRDSRTPTGAHYCCRNHGKFLVLHPMRIKV